MAFKRALWHSGLTYRQTCRQCNAEIQYTDHSLDFRPWYADGFVYCPRCKTPLRHNENMAIDAPTPASDNTKPAAQIVMEGEAAAPVAETPAPEASAVIEMPAPERPEPKEAEETPAAAALPAFCTKCGNPYGENDRFCSKCGNPRG